MSLTLLSTSETLELYLDKENTWLYLDWKGTLDLHNVQADCQKILAAIDQSGVKKALNDNSRITKISWELVKWVVDEYLLTAGQAGIDYVAWVHSQALDCRSDIDQLLPVADNLPPQVALFDDVAAAYAWLQNINVPVLPAGQHQPFG